MSPDSSGNYRNYDPRFRPWYVSAASGSKDVVILLDISESMKKNGRMALAKSAVISVLNTLGQSSMVSVVAFNDQGLEFSCFGEELVAATPRNVAKLEEFVRGLVASEGTKFVTVSSLSFSISLLPIIITSSIPIIVVRPSRQHSIFWNLSLKVANRMDFHL